MKEINRIATALSLVSHRTRCFSFMLTISLSATYQMLNPPQFSVTVRKKRIKSSVSE